MKKALALLLLLTGSVCANAAISVQQLSILTGAKWQVTNDVVQPIASADLFYVNLDKASTNYMMIDFGLNPGSPRFSAWGDIGLRAGGTGANFFIGYGYFSAANNVSHWNLHDALGSGWDCYFNPAGNGKCVVYNSLGRLLGYVDLTLLS